MGRFQRAVSAEVRFPPRARGWVRPVLLLCGALLLPRGVATAQVPGGQILRGGREVQNARPLTRGLPDYNGGFTFCRLEYNRQRSLRSGLGWSTDYPASDHNFLTRLEELTATPISLWASGDPGYATVLATDRDLFKCPFLFMSDPGSYDFTETEVARLREYFLKGGFLWADDLWDDMGGWSYLRSNLMRILPGHEIVELTAEHPIFSSHYIVPRIPQIPALNFWRPGSPTSEVPGITDTARMYAIFDERGRIMVLVSYNTDFGDGWEREGDSPEYFYTFSPSAYAVAINVALWIMTR